MKSTLTVIVALSLATGITNATHAEDGPSIEPPDVFVRVAQVLQEIELLRAEMGKPHARSRILEIDNAQPREVFFQALTLYKKADRLCFQVVRDTAPRPEAPSEAIQPRHVCAVVDAALTRILLAKKKLGIPESISEVARDDSKTPTDVLRSIVAANRQLNLVLDDPFSPSDSFQAVTLALHHVARLRSSFAGERAAPTPGFRRGKRPADVYELLIRCLEQLRDIAETSGVKIAGFQRVVDDPMHTTPSDVYDLASLLVSELAYLHERLTGSLPPDDSYPPGTKFPSHVYQRTGMLSNELERLTELVNHNPDWLRKQDELK